MKVRVNSTYRFNANYFMDHHAQLTNHERLAPGTIVRVINLHGCPPANTMGQCYVELATAPKGGKNPFVMVSTSSLEKV